MKYQDLHTPPSSPGSADNSHPRGSRCIFSVYRQTSNCEEWHEVGSEPPPNLEKAALPTFWTDLGAGKVGPEGSVYSRMGESWLVYAQAAIIKCHRVDGLNLINLFHRVLEARKSKILRFLVRLSSWFADSAIVLLLCLLYTRKRASSLVSLLIRVLILS